MNNNELIEKLSSDVHDSWWDEKLKQGFHAPLDCPKVSAPYNKWASNCDKCHNDMYPYNELPENIKEYDRVTVRKVLLSLSKYMQSVVLNEEQIENDCHSN